MDACSSAQAGRGFVSSVTGYVDCQAQNLDFGAWSAFGMPGSTLQVVLTGFLTITIALIGYRLLLGSRFTLRETTLAFVKIGAVFALATSWAAYKPLVYDLVTDGPGQFVSEIGPKAGVVGSDGTLLQHLDYADRAFEQLAILGPGYPQSSDPAQTVPPPFIGFDSFAIGGARILFLLSVIAGLGIVRIVSALLLALGPFFIAFLMFDSTRSLFEGWVRVLAGAALAAIGVSVALGLELGLMEPWLDSVLALRMSGEALPAMPTELFVLTCFFSLAVIVSLYLSMRVAWAFRLPERLRVALTDFGATQRSGSARRSELAAQLTRQTETERSRAAAIASVVSTVGRRERLALLDGAPADSSNERAVQVRSNDVGSIGRAVPLGSSFTRRSARRVSAMSGKRDAGA